MTEFYQNYVDRTVSQNCNVYRFGKIIANLYYLTVLMCNIGVTVLYLLDAKNPFLEFW